MRDFSSLEIMAITFLVVIALLVVVKYSSNYVVPLIFNQKDIRAYTFNEFNCTSPVKNFTTCQIQSTDILDLTSKNCNITYCMNILQVGDIDEEWLFKYCNYTGERIDQTSKNTRVYSKYQCGNNYLVEAEQ